MYRDVRLDRDIVESVLQAGREGPRFPWLTTLERMGYAASGTWELPLLLLLAFVLWLVWNVGEPRERRFGSEALCAWLGGVLLVVAWAFNGTALENASSHPYVSVASLLRLLLAIVGLTLGIAALRMAARATSPPRT